MLALPLHAGQRYQADGPNGSVMLPLAQLTTDDCAFWLLGPATYVDHKRRQPMAITWRLAYQLPGDLIASFCAAAS